MDLLMKNIHMCRQTKHGETQITLDEDLNVPDIRPDVELIVQSRGRLIIEHTRAETQKFYVDGFMEAGILYMDNTKERQLHRLNTKLPFDEAFSMDGLEPGQEGIRLRHEIEDLSVSLINSRKLAIRALVSLDASVDEIQDLSAAVQTPASIYSGPSESGAFDSPSHEVSGSIPSLCEKTQKLEFLQLEVRNKDILRLKEDVQLPSNKPDIREILWEDVELRSCRTHLADGKITVQGSLFLFVLYLADAESESLQWLEQSIPLEGELACSGCSAELIPDIEVTLAESSVAAKEDIDGELRTVHLEGTLELTIRLYGTDQAEILTDVYSPEKDLELTTSDETYETLIVRNESKCKAQGKLRIQSAKPRILQLMHSSGSVRIDKTEIVPDGIKIQGALPVSILYISPDDTQPIAVLEGSIPFSHVAEAQGITNSTGNDAESPGVSALGQTNAPCRYSLTTSLDQLSATMSDSEEIEVRASIGLNLFAVRTEKQRCIHEIHESDYAPERLEAIPGITGYIVQEGDTLWDIAKEYFSTPAQIMEMNGLTSDQIKKGSCLILMKNVKILNSYV
ncbi:MAG: DUF3794 domain-containing protein [Lachnospiraceae bacterium]|nr:DUF3794 domain-containing protein [Lachnospiraceae bacterium]